MKQFGLIGYPLSHSFSERYFTEKFEKEGIKDCNYKAFPIDSIDKLPALLAEYPNLVGLNVTIPYKEQVIKFLNEIDEEAAAVGAVNTLKISYDENGAPKLKGYNSDIYGFEQSLKPMLTADNKKALILGTGGASKAIKYILTKLGISYLSASIEELQENEIRYEEITESLVRDHTLIINATPLGTFPKVENAPAIPYEAIGAGHVMFDLVYNPEITKFLSYGIAKGAKTKNGLAMLYGQAERSWSIWNE